jgi:hypothetical protein
MIRAARGSGTEQLEAFAGPCKKRQKQAAQMPPLEEPIQRPPPILIDSLGWLRSKFDGYARKEFAIKAE